MTSAKAYDTEDPLSRSVASGVWSNVSTDARQRFQRTDTEKWHAQNPYSINSEHEEDYLLSTEQADEQFEYFMNGIIWKVCVLDTEEAKVVCTALMDWIDAHDDHIKEFKRILTKAVFGVGKYNFRGSPNDDFICLSNGRDQVFAVFESEDNKKINIDSTVTIYYAHTPFAMTGYRGLSIENKTWKEYCSRFTSKKYEKQRARA